MTGRPLPSNADAERRLDDLGTGAHTPTNPFDGGEDMRTTGFVPTIALTLGLALTPAVALAHPGGFHGWRGGVGPVIGGPVVARPFVTRPFVTRPFATHPLVPHRFFPRPHLPPPPPILLPASPASAC